MSPRPRPDSGPARAPARPLDWRLAALLLAAALALLYQDALRTGFMNDDYVFMEQIRTQGPWRALLSGDPLSNYFRPLSRQAYFSLLLPVTGFDALVPHLLNFALFLAALWLLADLLRRFLPAPSVLVGVTYFAVLHGQRVLLTWVSCAQDLLALAGGLGAMALYARGRLGWAAAAFGAAALSKESVLPLPALLVLWSRWQEKRSWPEALRRASPVLAVAAGWGLVALAHGTGRGGVEGVLRPGLSETVAAYAHLVQSLLFLEHPSRWFENFAKHPPLPLPMLLLLPLAFWMPARPGAPGASPAPGATAAALRFGAAWCLIAVLPVAVVSHAWSAYYYTFAAVGAALVVGALAARIDRAWWLLLAPALLWLHAGASGARAFAVEYRPWVWTSHLTPFYFERGATYVRQLSREMLQLVPRPEPRSRFYFATLPYFAGFQMGNGPLLRALYRDPTLESYFYTQFSDSNAADFPCDFFYWDGLELKRLYARTQGRFTQVAGDLLLMDRAAGASHALTRALAAGEEPREAHYWMGWARIALGDRPGAEDAWHQMGARDSTAAYWASLRAAEAALAAGDTLRARRALLAAIPYHVGRPEAHRMLGALLFEREPKYGLLELWVALRLDPADDGARRWLAAGLLRLGLDEQARPHLERLLKSQPALASDPELGPAIARLRGAARESGVREFP